MSKPDDVSESFAAVEPLLAEHAQIEEQLAEVIAAPVAAPTLSDLGPLAGVGLTAAVALWLGALVMTMRPRTSGLALLGTTRSSARMALHGVTLAVGVTALQGVLVGAVVVVVTDAPVAMIPAAALAAVSMVLFLHALVAWAGNVGRAIALVVGVCVLVAASAPSAPAWLESLGALGPLDAAGRFLTAAAGDGGSVGAVVLLLVWAAAGFAADVAATAWARRRAGGLVLAAA